MVDCNGKEMTSGSIFLYIDELRKADGTIARPKSTQKGVVMNNGSWHRVGTPWSYGLEQCFRPEDVEIVGDIRVNPELVTPGLAEQMIARGEV